MLRLLSGLARVSGLAGRAYAGLSPIRSSQRVPSVRWALCLGVLALAAVPSASAAAATVLAYPSSQSISATGSLPEGGQRQVAYNAAIGEREGALVVVRAAHRVSVDVTTPPSGGVSIHLFFGHFVSVKGRPVPDALEPWDGRERPTERLNQPLLAQLEVPYGTRPGSYSGAITVTADGRRTAVPLRIRVFPVTLPRPGSRIGNLLTSFHLSPESYVAKAAQLYGFTNNEQRTAANRSLFGLLGSYRMSPGSWGFGEPRGPGGYESSPKWWLDSAGNFLGQIRSSPGFSALRIPISSNRTTPRNYIARLSPFEPEKWCDYLRGVRTFWAENEALGPDSLAYLFGYDEPGPSGQRLVARQAKTLHQCFAGGRQLMTGNPSSANGFLWDGKGGDDLDIWTVLSRRFYGTWTGPADARAGTNHSRDRLRMIEKVRAKGAMVWAYTYTGTPGTPGFAATAPLSDSRMLMLWTALEGVQGMLYTQGVTSYTKVDPLDSIDTGERVLVYPGPSGPMPSARLEQIRDGIEDWAILNLVRRRHGAAGVRAILGAAGLFSTSRAGTQLACNLGCELKSETKYAWPRWSRDVSTPRRIEAARLAALKLAR
jgi:Glycoside hydrolase 123, catalytic domain